MSTASKWAGMPMLGFDLESTGVNPHTDRIVTAALVDIHTTRRPHGTGYVVDPGIDIPESAAEIHGYTRDRAIAEATHPDTGALLFEVTGLLALAMGRGIPIVGMNLSYDLTMLEAENRRHGIDTLTDRLGRGGIQPIVDVLVLDKYADPYRKGGRKLDQLCAVYDVVHTGAHDAGGDALAACRLWPRIMAKHARKFPGHTLASLHQSQVQWRRDQADSLRAYFDRQGTEHDGVCGEWPLHVRCAPATVGASS